MSGQSRCFNKARRLGSATDGVERREGEEKRFLKHLQSAQPVGLHVCHVTLLIQESQYGLNSLSKIYNVLIYNTEKNHPLQYITGREHGTRMRFDCLC